MPSKKNKRKMQNLYAPIVKELIREKHYITALRLFYRSVTVDKIVLRKQRADAHHTALLEKAVDKLSNI